MTQRVGLTEFAASTTTRRNCYVCTIVAPADWAEVVEALNAGRVTKVAAVRWLRDVCGYEAITMHKLVNHLSVHV